MISLIQGLLNLQIFEDFPELFLLLIPFSNQEHFLGSSIKEIQISSLSTENELETELENIYLGEGNRIKIVVFKFNSITQLKEFSKQTIGQYGKCNIQPSLNN